MPLRVVIPARSEFIEETNEFIDTPEKVYNLEHCLLSMARWEGITKRCFLTSKLDLKDVATYVQCMCDDYIPDDEALLIARVYRDKIETYIFDERFAHKRVSGRNGTPKSSENATPKFIPTEELYYVMFERGIPITCEKWHFSRLMSLLRVYSSKDKKSKGKGKSHMSADQMARLSAINRSRLNGG